MRQTRANILFLGIFCIIAFPLRAQNQDSTYFRPDSSAKAKIFSQADDENIYELTRFQFSLVDTTRCSVRQMELNKMAGEAAMRGQFAVANVLLEELLSELTADSTQAYSTSPFPSGSSHPVSQFKLNEKGPGSVWTFEKRFQMGFDLNKQNFNLTTETGDSSIQEEVNTPTSQFELAFVRQKDFGNEWQIRNVTSYDKQNIRNSGLVSFLGSFRDRTIRLRIQDRGDYNFYQSNHDWSYFHNIFNSTMIYDGEKFDVSGAFDFSVRNYLKEESSYPNFIEPAARFNMNFMPNYRWTINGNFNYDQKIHSAFGFNNYLQNQLGSSIRYSWKWNHFVKAGVNYQSKNFQSSLDTATVSLTPANSPYESNRYQELMFLGEWSFPLSKLLLFRLQPSYGRREYEKQIVLSPDYSQFQFQGNSIFRISETWNLNLGWEVENRKHKTKDPAIAAEVEQENYTRNIYSFGFDLSRISDYYLSVTYSFEQLRYPDSPQTGGVGEISLHTDRNIQSLSVFANWKIWNGIDLNTIINLDNDNSASAADPNTSKSKLISFQLQYSF